MLRESLPAKKSSRPSSWELHASSALCIASRPNAAKARAAALAVSVRMPSAIPWNAKNPHAIFALGCDLARQLKRNQVLASTWSRGLVVAAVDGIEICSSFVGCCSRCLERTVKDKLLVNPLRGGHSFEISGSGLL